MALAPLRISIYPDLTDDDPCRLNRYIIKEFMEELKCDVDMEVECSADPYNLEQMVSVHLGVGKEAYDVMEVDTMLLGELVESGKLLPLDDHFTVTEAEFAKSAVQSVNYKNHLYGVPTLQCATFLMEVQEVDPTRGSTTPVLKDWVLFQTLQDALDVAHNSGKKLCLAGDFSNKWSLPLFYMQAYLCKHSPVSVHQCFNSDIDMEVVANMKHFIDYGALPDGSNPTTDGTYDMKSSKFIDDIASSQHILLYVYSEILAKLLRCKHKPNSVLSIISPPLSEYNHLLTYTDAVVVNKSRFVGQRSELILKFIKFYTSLKFRTKYAMGDDLKAQGIIYPRYALPAHKEFFAKTDDPYYRMFNSALQYSVASPNHGMYHTVLNIKKKLLKILDMDTNCYC